MLNIFKQFLIAALMVLTGVLIGFNATESYYKEMARIEKLSLEDLYQQEMITGKTVVLKKFFPQLEMVRHTRAGTLIFDNGVDSLYLIRVDIIDGEKNYTLEDNHNNTWYLFPEGDSYFLSKKDEKK